VTTPLDDDGEFSELYDANLPRADMVAGPAHGYPGWLVMKADEDAAGLFDPEFVRDLIAKSPEETPVPEPSGAGETVLANGIVIKGSPDAMAAFFGAARKPDESERRPTPADVAAAVSKADLSTKDQNDLPDSAFAYIEPGGTKDADGKTTPRSLRHFNISDKAHADNAAARIAQGAKFGDKAKSKVEAAQRKFGETPVKKMAELWPISSVDELRAAIELVRH